MRLEARMFHNIVFWLLIAALSILLTGCSSPRVRPVDVVPVSIERSEHLEVNGTRLFLQIRGRDRRAPVLLWLHGGPGAPERPLFRYFNSDLERRFVVAYWDQRGAGRSFSPKADKDQLTIKQHLADLDVVVNHLRQTLTWKEVTLVGHSWGAALGLMYAQTHPEKVFALIGISPLISTREAQLAEYRFVLSQASRRRHEDVLERVREIGAPPYKTVDQQLAMESLAERYGAVFHKKPRRVWVVIHGIVRGLVTPWEIPGFIRANNVSLEAMNEELLTLDVANSVPSIDVPVFFFLGRYDRHVDSRIAARYFVTLQAPLKRMIWFEDSAHNIPFEQPDLFNATVISTLDSIGSAR